MAEIGKHSITINDKLYKGIKEYCSLNGLKINAFVDDLLTRAFNVEKFGATPFQSTPVIIPLVKEDKKAEEAMSDIIKSVGGDEAYSAMVSDLLLGPEPEEVKAKTEEVLRDEPSRQGVAESVAMSAPEVPQETAKIADNIPQPAPTTVQKEENPAPEIVQKPRKKVTRLN